MRLFQIYDMILVRHGLMVVGGAIGGKSSALKTLAKSLTQLSREGLMDEQRVTHARHRIYILSISGMSYIVSLKKWGLIYKITKIKKKNILGYLQHRHCTAHTI